MTTYERNGWELMEGAPYLDEGTGIRVVPGAAVSQPAVFDSEIHAGMWICKGKETKAWQPPAEAAAPQPLPLTPNQVIDLMLAVIGAAGFAACVRSDADAMVAWRYKMSVARDITKDQAANGLSVIVASSLMTAEQRTAILASWPTA